LVGGVRFRSNPGQENAREQPGKVAFPGNGGRGGHQAFEHSAVSQQTNDRKDEGAKSAAEQGQGNQIAEQAKDEAAGPDMAGVPGEQPSQAPAEQNSTQRH